MYILQLNFNNKYRLSFFLGTVAEYNISYLYYVLNCVINLQLMNAEILSYFRFYFGSKIFDPTLILNSNNDFYKLDIYFINKWDQYLKQMNKYSVTNIQI